jgi:hypothetical protein
MGTKTTVKKPANSRTGKTKTTVSTAVSTRSTSSTATRSTHPWHNQKDDRVQDTYDLLIVCGTIILFLTILIVFMLVAFSGCQI